MPCSNCGKRLLGERAEYIGHAYCDCTLPPEPDDRPTLRDQFAMAVSYSVEDWPPDQEEMEKVFGELPTDYQERIVYYAKMEAKIRYIKADACMAERNGGKG